MAPVFACLPPKLLQASNSYQCSDIKSREWDKGELLCVIFFLCVMQQTGKMLNGGCVSVFICQEQTMGTFMKSE